MIIFCYTEISEVGDPRPVAGLATPLLVALQALHRSGEGPFAFRVS